MKQDKTIARLIAVQVLYDYDLYDQSENIELLRDKIVQLYYDKELYEEQNFTSQEIDLNLLTSLLDLVLRDLVDIDEIIAAHLSEQWKIENLNITLRNILRLGIAELKFYTKTPYKIIISEYANLASEFLVEKEVGFVNSLLNKFALSIRKEG